MANVQGSYTNTLPVISQNTAAVIKHRAKFYSGTGSISLPLAVGKRYVILAAITAGPTMSIGFGSSAGTITDSRFTFTQAAGPLDLSDFFEAAPFSEYEPPVGGGGIQFLVITATGVVTAAIVEMQS